MSFRDCHSSVLTDLDIYLVKFWCHFSVLTFLYRGFGGTRDPLGGLSDDPECIFVITEVYWNVPAWLSKSLPTLPLVYVGVNPRSRG